jgi:hypothetical protein
MRRGLRRTATGSETGSESSWTASRQAFRRTGEGGRSQSRRRVEAQHDPLRPSGDHPDPDRIGTSCAGALGLDRGRPEFPPRRPWLTIRDRSRRGHRSGWGRLDARSPRAADRDRPPLRGRSRLGLHPVCHIAAPIPFLIPDSILIQGCRRGPLGRTDPSRVGEGRRRRDRTHRARGATPGRAARDPRPRPDLVLRRFRVVDRFLSHPMPDQRW